PTVTLGCFRRVDTRGGLADCGVAARSAVLDDRCCAVERWSSHCSPRRRHHNNEGVMRGLAIIVSSTLLFAATTALAQRAPSQPPRPSSRTAETESETWNAPMFTTGAFVFGASYGSALFVAATSNHQGDSRLWVPVFGPWLDLADRGTCPI